MIQLEIKNKIKKYFFVFVISFSFLFLYNINSQFYLPTGDEIHILVASYSFAVDGDFDLKNNYDSGTFYKYLGNDRQIVENNGKELPFHSITYAAFFYPVIKLAKHLGTDLEGILFSIRIFVNILWSFAFVLLYDTIIYLIGNKNIADFVPFIICLVPSFLVYGNSAMPDSMAFVLMSALINLLIKIRLDFSILKSVFIALLYSLLFLIHPRFSLFSFWVILIVFHAFFSSSSNFSYLSVRRILPFIAVGAFFLILKIIINFHVYDSLSVFGVQEKIKSVFNLFLGFKSLPHTLFDGWQGLIGVFPFVLIGTAGLLYIKSEKVFPQSFLIIVIAQLVISGSLEGWEGNAVYWGGRFHLIYLGYFIIAFFAYVDYLLDYYNQNGFKSTLPLILLVLIPVFFQLIQLYYVVISDGFGFSAQVYGPWSNYFPQFFKSLGESIQYQKTFLFLIISISIFIGLLNIQSWYFFVFSILLLSASLFNYSFYEKVYLDNSFPKKIDNIKREVIEYSNNIYLPFNQKGKWQLEFKYKIDGKENLKEDEAIATYSIVQYRGRIMYDVFSENTVYLDDIDIQKNINQKDFIFTYSGVGACFFRIYKYPNSNIKFLLYCLKIKKL